jgi:hypothetical protein
MLIILGTLFLLMLIALARMWHTRWLLVAVFFAAAIATQCVQIAREDSCRAIHAAWLDRVHKATAITQVDSLWHTRPNCEY